MQLSQETQTGGDHECYGVGLDANIVTASIKALMSGVNRLATGGKNAKAA